MSTNSSKHFHEELKTLNNLIATHAKRKELSEAIKHFEDAVSKGWANAHTYAGAINCSIRCGNMAQAKLLFSRLKAHGRGVKADVVHYTNMMKGYCEEGAMTEAFTLLEEMKIRRVDPNIRTINTLLRGCVQTGDIEKAESLMAALGKEYNVVPDVSSWEYLIILLSQGLKTDKVLPILGRVKGGSRNEHWPGNYVYQPGPRLRHPWRLESVQESNCIGKRCAFYR